MPKCNWCGEYIKAGRLCPNCREKKRYYERHYGGIPKLQDKGEDIENYDGEWDNIVKLNEG